MPVDLRGGGEVAQGSDCVVGGDVVWGSGFGGIVVALRSPLPLTSFSSLPSPATASPMMLAPLPNISSPQTMPQQPSDSLPSKARSTGKKLTISKAPHLSRPRLTS